ncbi:phosphohydrolase [Bacillus phage SP-15]|uniref:Phosphohydrolase n=1 Tax=Bacillus phage SP-15 TaxID=1792032 RepID=A0A127AW73_9CAUD|nr:DHH phosphoesterase [Bacillus phage SP-15]AMM44898.1 phosphohydrolase [Bacillus phage SP-15]
MVMTNNLAIFTHVDLDGAGSPVVAKYLYGDRVKEVFRVDNKDVTEKVQYLIDNKENYKDSTIFICDHSPTFEMYNKLVESGLDFYIFDHHKSSELQELNDYRVEINTDFCGTYLFFDWLVMNDPELTPEQINSTQDFVYHVNDYDMWIHESPKSKQLHQLLYELGWNRFLDRFSSNIKVEFNEGEKLILELARERVQDYVESYRDKVTVLTDNLGDTYIAVFAERNQSELGHYLLETFGVKYVCMINPKSLGCSLRGNGEVDVSEIARNKAKLYSSQSGGHKSAAGFSYTLDDLSDIIERLFRLNVL